MNWRKCFVLLTFTVSIMVVNLIFVVRFRFFGLMAIPVVILVLWFVAFSPPVVRWFTYTPRGYDVEVEDWDW
jgi:hypothetical protein